MSNANHKFSFYSQKARIFLVNVNCDRRVFSMRQSLYQVVRRTILDCRLLLWVVQSTCNADDSVGGVGSKGGTVANDVNPNY
ncbi:MAG: hypothetical protein HC899_14950 [Leptolyngbyaceae cyanobacterium SM1_4_3]|nr:hypothetical protein [Leptolyngbyaceae cyanobacterium SM1_4_3]